MTYTLRQYQQEAIDAGAAFLLSGKRNGLIVLPTGSGKSLVVAGLVEKLDAPCLVFQPSKEILEQNLAKFHSYGYRPAVYSASMGRKTVGDITLATIGSVAGNKNRANKAHLFEGVGYVIVDEADLVNPKEGMYRSFLAALDPSVRVIGLTATPYRMARNSQGVILRFLTRTQPKVFHTLVYYAQCRDLFDEGYLAKLEYHKVAGFNRHAVSANSNGTDYDDRSLQMHLYAINFKDKIVKVIERLKDRGRKNILIFTRFVSEAEYVANKVGAVVVTAETSKAERTAIIREFRNGNLPYVVNVGVLTTGADFPSLETVVLARPTMSLRLYYQMVGRAVRPHPEKETAWIVDMVGLSDQFGPVEDLNIVDGGNGKWHIANAEQQLTNVYWPDSSSTRCQKCGASIGFWARNEKTGNAAPIQRPVPGIPPNIAIRSENGRTVYAVVKPGEGEFISHYATCGRQQQMRATA